MKTALQLALLLSFLSACGSHRVLRQIDEVPLPPEAEGTGEKELMDYQYTVKANDTLKSIARKELGSPLLWRHLAEWNKLPPSSPPAPGTVILIPLQFRGIMGGKGATSFIEGAIRMRTPAAGSKRPDEIISIGERFVYDVKWFAITAGQASLNVLPMADIDGNRCYHFMADAKSGLVFFFKVNDRIESYTTEDRLLPIRFEKHLSEGKYRKDIIATFDRRKLEAHWGDKTGAIGPECRDLLGAFFNFRTMPIPAPGRETSVCVHTDNKNYELFINVLRRERIRVPAGDFNTIVIKPKLKFEGLWRQKGDILIWLSDDKRRIPVLVVSKVFLLGSVDVVLKKVETR